MKYALVLAAALTCGAVSPSFSQTGGTPPQTTQRADNDRDWGWIGLLGLVGLAGLMGRKRDTYDSTNRTTAAR